jgi:hypothetical protein
MRDEKKPNVEKKTSKNVEQSYSAGFGRGKFFSGKRKKNSELAKCNTSCSGSCK